MKLEKKEVKIVKVEKYIVKIYLKRHRFCKYKSIPLLEEEVDQFYKELNDSNKVVEFGDFYFSKESLDYIRLKEVIVKEKMTD